MKLLVRLPLSHIKSMFSIRKARVYMNGMTAALMACHIQFKQTWIFHSVTRVFLGFIVVQLEVQFH